MNAVTCLTCGKRIESHHRHDFVSCDCPDETSVSVDGGAAYQKRCVGKRARWREEDGSIWPRVKST